MPTMTYTRSDVEVLAQRLSDRAGSVLLFDMPMLCRDLKSASRVLRWMLSNGIPPTSIVIDQDNGPQ
jgi:hypothetical protein